MSFFTNGKTIWTLPVCGLGMLGYYTFYQNENIENITIAHSTHMWSSAKPTRQSVSRLNWQEVSRSNYEYGATGAGQLKEGAAGKILSASNAAKLTTSSLTLEKFAQLNFEDGKYNEREVAEFLKTYPNVNPAHSAMLIKIIENSTDVNTKSVAMANLGNLAFVPEVRSYMIQTIQNGQFGPEEQNQAVHALAAKIDHYGDVAISFYTHINRDDTPESLKKAMLESLASFEINRNGVSLASSQQELEEAKGRLSRNILNEQVRKEVFNILNLGDEEGEAINAQNGQTQSLSASSEKDPKTAAILAVQGGPNVKKQTIREVIPNSTETIRMR